MDFTKRPQDDASIHHFTQNKVSYLDASSLMRPQGMTRPVLLTLAAVLLIAIAISGFIGFKAIDSVLHGEEHKAQLIQSNIAREVDHSMPSIIDLYSVNDSDLFQYLTDAGYTIYDSNTYDASISDASSVEIDPNVAGVDLIRVPNDVDIDDAALIYSKNFNHVDAVDVTLYYNGSWHVVTDPSANTISIKYIDFNNQTPTDVITAAKVAQGWDNADYLMVTENGVDSIGNTYEMGTLTQGDKTFEWRISTCLMADAFSVSDLPENVHYVGIRITEIQ